MSYRQAKRLYGWFRQEGDAGLMHRLRGRESNRKVDPEVRSQVIAAFRAKYADFGPTLAAEYLARDDGLVVSVPTLRRWLVAEGLWQQRRRRSPHRRWRARKAHFGEMIQMDGSDHDWFESRRGKATLMVMIDDATSKVSARFFEEETTAAAFEMFREHVGRHGLPQSLYERFMVTPEKSADVHRRVPRTVKLERVLCFQESRIVQSDWTVSWRNRHFQLTKGSRRRSLVKQSLTVCEQLDGTVLLLHKGRTLAWEELPERPRKQKQQPEKTPSGKRPSESQTSQPVSHGPQTTRGESHSVSLEKRKRQRAFWWVARLTVSRRGRIPQGVRPRRLFSFAGMEFAVVTRDEPMDQPASTMTPQISHAAGACGIDDIETVAFTRALACTTDRPAEASARSKFKEKSN